MAETIPPGNSDYCFIAKFVLIAVEETLPETR
jgi:hypothetical protein